MSRTVSPRSADLGLLALALIWGVNFSVVKSVLAEVPPLAFNALRFPLAVVALGWLLKVRPGKQPLDRRDIPRLAALGLAGNVAYQLCFIIGIDLTQAGNASLLLSTTPVWTVFLSALAGHELPNRWVLFGVGGTLLGMVLVVAGGSEEISLGSETVRGDLLMIAASVIWSVYTVAGRAPVEKYGALPVTAWTLIIGTPLLVAMGVPDLRTTDLAAVSGPAWAGIAYAGVLAIGIAYLLWYRGVEALGNNRTAVYSNLVPVAALITAWIWLGERPAPLQLGGAAVILIGLTVARLAQSAGPSLREASATPSAAR
jgi:drug/metabolite transporter (DMT)-like permease